MRISVVVPLFSDGRTYVNRLPLQRRQWISLKNQTDRDFEIVGVDNQSYDDVGGLLKKYFPHAVVFRHEIPKNTVGARVEAVRQAGVPHVVTLDSDCIVYPHFIENWKRYIARNAGTIGVGGLYWYNGVVLSGREFILGDPPVEEIDYPGLEAFLRKTSPGHRPFYPIPSAILNDDASGIRVEPYNWGGGFYYSNAYFPKDLYIRAGSPDSDLTGYGHDDTLFGFRLQAMKVPVNYVRGVPVIHQCHRDVSGKDLSHHEDCRTAHEHEERVQKLAKDLFP